MNFLKLPLKFESLVIETTNWCNAKCDICYQSTGPKGKDENGIIELDINSIHKILADAIEIKNLKKHLHVSGGEAFKNASKLKRIFECADDLGFEEISATTNAFWAKDPERASNTISELKKCGLSRLEISWDYWHGRYVEQESIKNCLISCRRENVYSILRILHTKSHKSSSIISKFNPEELRLPNEIFCSPVILTGRAGTHIQPTDSFKCGSLDSCCYGALNLTINSEGSVFPCCSGLDQSDHIDFGNIHKESIDKIVEKMEQSLLLKILVFRGPGALLQLIKETSECISSQKLDSACHLCTQLFNDKITTESIKSKIDSIEKALMTQILSSIKTHKNNVS